MGMGCLVLRGQNLLSRRRANYVLSRKSVTPRAYLALYL